MVLLRIAHVEDSIEEQKRTKQMLEDWTKQSEFQVHVDGYIDSNRLVMAIDDAWAAYDLYILDIHMRSRDEGLQLAHTIRKTDELATIIFISGVHEYALDSFEVFAMYFFTKPLAKAKFHSFLDRFGKLMINRSREVFVFPFEKQTGQMPLYQVVYIEADGHHVKINGSSEARYRMKLSILASDYAGTLVRCHRSYIVNLAHVVNYSTEKLQLSNNTQVPIGREYTESTLKALSEYRLV